MILNEKQIEAINCIDHNLQIIACAGSGKTEVITRRIIKILLSDQCVMPENIVAFTFTEKAAQNMKKRIAETIDEMGVQINVENMFVGTIHSFCKYILNRFSEEYKDVNILDSVKEHLFISKYNEKCGAKTLELSKSLRDSALFSECVDKMIYHADRMNEWRPEVKTAFDEYRKILKEKGYISFSFLIYELIEKIKTNKEIQEYLKTIKHLVVDEYQDVDDLQERLIHNINDYGAKVCVVGDDDQTIYQFRGSNANNMIGFSKRYDDVVTKRLDINYRSEKSIVGIADEVIINNSNRLEKNMIANSSGQGIVGGLVATCQEDEYSEIVDNVISINKRGVDYSDIVVLLRKRTRLSDLINAFESKGIPCQADISDNFFCSETYEHLRMVFDYLVDKTDDNRKKMDEKWETIVEHENYRKALRSIKRADETNERFADILIKFTELSGYANDGNRKYIDAFGKILKDFDSVYQTDSWMFRTDNLKYFLDRENGAKNEYRYTELVENTDGNSVKIMTIHKSKGLEFDVVIIPDLQEGFFPSSKRGGKKWYSVLGGIFEETKDKYDTDIDDERKLFYVAITRAKKELYLYANIEKKDVSPFLLVANETGYLNINIPEVIREHKDYKLRFSSIYEKQEPEDNNTEEEEEYYIDIGAIRRDMLADLYEAAHAAHFGGAYLEADELRQASDDEVLRRAQCSGININNYMKRK